MSDQPVALVTGGGTGIGSACCRRLAAEGFRVGIHYRSSEESAVKLAAELDSASDTSDTSDGSGQAFTIQADLMDSASLVGLV